MYIEQLYTGCLAEAAYYIESDGEAAIIDPIRETAPYLTKLKERKATLKYIFETHFHADFVSGHIDLAKHTNASIVFGPNATTKYAVHNAKDGELLTLGKIKIKVLHTPGHTPESACYLLLDENGREHALFSGDTLFVGDVGRPDLLDGKMSKEELAGMLYDSLNQKIKTLPDDVILYPAHGAGSACGKNIGKETWSTIGTQKKLNYALQSMTKEKFISLLTSGLQAPPQYFFNDAEINKNGYSNIDVVMQRNTKALSVTEVEHETKQGVLILDTRHPDAFTQKFIPQSLNIGLNGSYAVWLGTLVDINTPLIVVAEEGKEEESILRAARIGYENIKGYLKGGINAWEQAGKLIDSIRSIEAGELAEKINTTHSSTIVLDVRKPDEYETAKVKGAINASLADLPKQVNKLDKNKNYLIHCAGGYRSVIAASILKAHGFTTLANVLGGFAAIKQTKAPIESGVLAE